MDGPLPTAEDVARRTWSLDWLAARGDTVSWVESSPESGRDVLLAWSRRTAVTTPIAEGVGNDVHAYGARPYVLTPDGVVATRRADGQVWDLGTATRLTAPPSGHGDLATSGPLITCVRESPDGDELVVVHRGSGTVEVLREAPFLAAPRLDGDRLAWTQWPADAMPWDAAEVWVGRRGPDGRLHDARRVAGGPGESAHQPAWGPDGWLYLLTDRTGWWNLHRWRAGDLEPVAPMSAECGAAPWESGYASYAFLPDGRIAVIAENGPVQRLVLVRPGEPPTELATPFTSFKPFLAATADAVAVIGAAPDRAPRVALVDIGGGGVTVVRGTGPVRAPAPYVTTADSDGVPIPVVVHPAARGDGPPPLIVRAHAGPTDNTHQRLDEEVRFFTGRGFTVADVDYRGSTGYGRAFRTALHGRWGELDAADCIAAASSLVRAGQARADALFVRGASAGGYTALRAVGRPDSPFSLAVARSAIVNPNRWTGTAPRFQRAHAATLAHDAADVDPAGVCRPVLLLHGRDDPVAPVADVIELVAALRDRHLLAGFTEFPGTGHHLSGAALSTALRQELAAYEAHLSELSR